MDADLLRYLEGMEKRQREYMDERMLGLENRLREYIDERTHDSETRIVRAFGAYQESSSVRMRKIEADVSNINSSTSQQLDAVQSKLLDLETRIISLEGPQGRTA
jgi:flagellar biosynthesis/type III secretory pathway protein FliH